MLPIMATRYRPVGLGYTPWPLGQEAQAPGGGAGLTTTDVAPIITAGGGFLTNLISAIRGTPAYPPGMYPGSPGYVEPFPWGTVVIVGGLAVGGYFLIKTLAKRKNPRRRRYRVYRRRR